MGDTVVDKRRTVLKSQSVTSRSRGGVVSADIVPAEAVDLRILTVRDHRVMLDADLAELYSIEIRALNQGVRRNIERFPDDFMFALSDEEWRAIRDSLGQTRGWGGRRNPPYAFTEQGVAMLSSVLRSDRAVTVNIEIMRAFVRLRRLLQSHADLALRVDELEAKYDSQFGAVFDAIRQLMTPPGRPRNPIGFVPPEDSSA